MAKLLVVTMHDVVVVSTSGYGVIRILKRQMDPGCVLGRFRVPVQGPVRGERPMHATQPLLIFIFSFDLKNKYF